MVNHDVIGTLETKVDMANRLAMEVQNLPMDKPIAYLALASDHLFAAEMQVRQFDSQHRQLTRPRVIDPIYENKPFHATDGTEFPPSGLLAARQFFAGKEDGRAFPTSTAYLKETLPDGKNLFEQDAQGSIVLYLNSSEPWPSLRNSKSPAQREDGFFLIGAVLKESKLDHANTILAVLGDNDDRGVKGIQKSVDNLRRNKMLFTARTMKCHLDAEGKFQCEIGKSLSDIGDHFRKNFDAATAKYPSSLTPMEKLYQGVKDLAGSDFMRTEGLTAETLVFSDLGRSQQELLDICVAHCNNVVLVQLKDGEGIVRRLK